MQLKKRFNIGIVLIICLTGITLVSCKGYYAALNIETPVPAKGQLPPDIQSLTLMNRSINNQFFVHQEDTLQNYFYRDKYQASGVVLDTDAVDSTMISLANLLNASGRYDVTIPEMRNIKREDAYNIIPDTLSTETVRNICKKYNTDALMVMEQFSTKAMTILYADTIKRHLETYPTFRTTLDLKYNAFFRIYKPGSQTIEIPLNDTIYWKSESDIVLIMMNYLPTIKQAVISAGIKVALDVDKKISTVWIPEKRGYFLLTRKNDCGKQLIDENKALEARAYWMEMAQSGNKKIKGRAEYNLALASELEGDLDKAMEWALKSYNTYYQHQTEIYLEKLDDKKARKLIQ